MTKEQFVEFANSISNLEDERKGIAEDVKERIEGAADEFSIEKKILRKAVKKYLKYQQDREKFMIEENAVDSILHEIVKIG